MAEDTHPARATPAPDPSQAPDTSSDTAAEPTREALTDRVAALEDVLSTLWLYTGWYRTTRELTTEQRELWADVIDADHRVQDEHHGYTGTHMAYAPIERWWRDDAPVGYARRAGLDDAQAGRG